MINTFLLPVLNNLSEYAKNPIDTLCIKGIDMEYQSYITLCHQSTNSISTDAIVLYNICNAIVTNNTQELNNLLQISHVNSETVNSKALVIAIFYGNSDAVLYLLRCLININYNDGLPLMISIHRNSPDLVEILFKHHAAITVRNDEPLLEAVKIGNRDIVRIMFDYKCDLIKNDYKALLFAVIRSRDITLVFLRVGIDKRVNSYEAPRLAALNNKPIMIKFLMDGEPFQLLDEKYNQAFLEVIKNDYWIVLAKLLHYVDYPLSLIEEALIIATKISLPLL